MAKQTHAENQSNSSRNTLIVMTLGALLVAGLVGWALTRTVEPATSVMAGQEQFPTTTVATNTSSSTPAVSDPNATTSTLSPIASSTSPVTFTSDTAPPPSEHSQSPEKAAVDRISAEDLRERINGGNTVVVDVRDAGSYAQGHIAGAISMPFASVEAQLDAIPKGKQIVTYCT
ncbi:MAG TPA: rhodanese-like domain-containing protein [Thermoanaerobaculia bacterium]|nr:rhodanese-like domain-containing protein [Thermoanaerobaculia bacterium]